MMPRTQGQCGVAGPANYHTPPRLPGADQKHPIDTGARVYGLARYTPNRAAGSFGNLHLKGGPVYWTPERLQELAELAAAGWTTEQLADRYGRSVRATREAIRRATRTKHPETLNLNTSVRQ